jgi:endonuclease/exonuclease/phosphatase family metal-dependent hydrolase
VCLLTPLCILTGCGSHRRVAPRTIRFSPAPSNEVKVMTFNIRVDTILDGFHRWKQRKQLVVDTIKSNAADVIGLQEAEMDQVQLIQYAMPQYKSYAVGRNDGRRKGETCAIFYRKDRFMVLESDTFWFSDTPTVPGTKDWGNLWPRICSWVHLLDKTTRTGFYVYNVHMDNLSQRSREKSADMLADKIAARRTQDPFIVMGDFNMSSDNPAMQHLQKVGYKAAFSGTVDAWSSVHFREPRVGTRHGFHGRTSGPMIDHIRLCDNIVPLEATVDQRNFDGKYPSDHFPVTAKVRITRPSQVSYSDTNRTNTTSARRNTSRRGGV